MKSGDFLDFDLDVLLVSISCGTRFSRFVVGKRMKNTLPKQHVEQNKKRRDFGPGGRASRLDTEGSILCGQEIKLFLGQ